jgi:GDP-fucose transporter C1
MIVYKIGGTPQKTSRIAVGSASASVQNAPPSTIRVALVVGFYIVTSISMIMVNKAVLNHAGLPLFFLWGQLVIAAVVLKAASLINLLTLPPVSLALLKSVAPLITINVIGLVLNTLCLKNIDAVMYQVARSLILPITVALSPIMQSQRISFKVFLCCLCITAGFLVGIFGENNFTVSKVGVVFGVLSSLSTAVHSFIIKNSFQSVKHNGAFGHHVKSFFLGLCSRDLPAYSSIWLDFYKSKPPVQSLTLFRRLLVVYYKH